jgi:HEAT repeat protein
MDSEPLRNLIHSIEHGTIGERNKAFERIQEYPFDQIKDFLFDGLRSNNHRIRSRCARLIGSMGDETIIFPLLQALSDESWSIRNSANEALRNLPETVVIPALNAIIASSPGNVSLLKSLVKLLGTYSHPDSAGILAAIFDTSDEPELIEAAVTALGKKEDEQSVDQLFHLLTHELWNVRKAAVTAISTLPWAVIKNHLAEGIGNPNRFTHLASIEILISRASGDVLDMLTETLKSKNVTAKLNALSVLSGIHTDESLTTMVSVLDDPNIRIRSRAVHEMGKSPSRAVFDLMNRCLNSSNELLKQSAIQVFGEMGTDSAIDILQDRLERESGQAKLHVMEALARCGSRRSIKLLLQHIAVPDHAADVAKILKSIDPDLAIQQIVNLLDEPDFFATAVKALIDLDKMKVLRYLSSKLSTGTPSQQEKAVEAMGLLGCQEALIYLENILNGDYSSSIKKMAETAMRRIKKSI